MKNFLKQNWDRCISLLLIVAAVIFYFCNIPESLVKRIMFWVMMVMSFAVPIFQNRKIRIAAGAIPVVACLSMLLLGIECSTFVDCLLVLLFIFWIGISSKPLKLLHCLLVASWGSLGVILIQAAKAEENIQSAEEAVIQSVNVKSNSNIYVSLEERGIFRVSSEVAKDWDFQAGDTVKVVIYNDEIVSCEK